MQWNSLKLYLCALCVYSHPLIQLKDSPKSKKVLTDTLAGDSTVEELYYAITSMANLNMPSE